MHEVIGRKVQLITTYPTAYDIQYINQIGTILAEDFENYRVALNDAIMHLPKEFFKFVEEFEPKLVLSLICQPDATQKVVVEKKVENELTHHDITSFDTAFIGMLDIDELKEMLRLYDEGKKLEESV